ncbi:MAG: phosphatidate cytidylyltransferase, partial [Pseudomonadota bacterium]
VATIIVLTLALWLSSGFVLLGIVVIATLAFSLAATQLGQPRAIKGMLYAAPLLVAAGHLRGEGDHMAGFVAVCFLCAVVFATDIGAYFVGRWLGGPKLSPTISPNKTISGAVGGLIAAMIFGTLTYVLFGLTPFWVATALAIPLSIVSQFGDLYESSMKRTAGVKDSGKIIPGHGGVMDRVDGLLFAAFALWLVSIAAGQWDAPANTFFATR